MLASASQLVATPAAGTELASGTDLSVVRGADADSCIRAEALEQDVIRRLGRNPFTRPVRQHIECLIVREQGSFVARLYERAPNGQRLGDREIAVATENCRELDDALALAVALLIDPEYMANRATPSVDPSSSPNLGASAPMSSSSHTYPDSKWSDASALVTTTQRVMPQSSVVRSAATGQVVVRAWSPVGDTRASLAGGISYGMLPKLGPDLDFSVQRRVYRSWHARVSVVYSPERAAVDAGSRLAIGITALRLSTCVEGSRQLALLACGGVVAGMIHSVVYEPRPRDPGDRGWAAVSLEGGSRWLAGPVVLEIRGLAVVPLARWSFESMGSQRLYRQAWIAPGLVVGLGTHFP